MKIKPSSLPLLTIILSFLMAQTALALTCEDIDKDEKSLQAVQNCQQQKASVNQIGDEIIGYLLYQPPTSKLLPGQVKRLVKLINNTIVLKARYDSSKDQNERLLLAHKIDRQHAKINSLIVKFFGKRIPLGDESLKKKFDQLTALIPCVNACSGGTFLTATNTPLPNFAPLEPVFVPTQLALADMNNAPLVININNDNIDEVLVSGSFNQNGSDSRMIYAFRYNGAVPGYPIIAPENLGILAANVADDIIVAAALDGDTVYIWHLNGTLKTVFSAPAGAVFTNPTIAQVIPGGQNELVFVDPIGKLYVTNQQGNILPGFPTTQIPPILGGFFPTPVPNGFRGWATVADMDNDGLPEIAVNAIYQKIYVFENNGALKFSQDLGAVAGFNSDPIGSPFIAKLSPAGSSKRVVTEGEQKLRAFNANSNSTINVSLPEDEEYLSESAGLIPLGSNVAHIATSSDNGDALFNGPNPFEYAEYVSKRYSNTGGVIASEKPFDDASFYAGTTHLTADVNCDGTAETLITTEPYGPNPPNPIEPVVIQAFTQNGPLDFEYLSPPATVTPVTLSPVIQTPHPYPNSNPPSIIQQDIITMPGSFSNTAIFVKAAETEFDYYDRIEIFNSTTGEIVMTIKGSRFLNGVWTPSVAGNSIGIRLVANGSGNGYGYRVEQAANTVSTRYTKNLPIYLEDDILAQPAVGKFFPDPSNPTNGKAGIVFVLPTHLEFVPFYNCTGTAATTSNWPQFRKNPERNGAL